MPKSLFRRFTKSSIAIFNIVLAIVFLFGCYAGLFNPKTFWILGFFALAAPYLLAVLLLFILFWFIAKRKLMLISIVAILLALKPIGELFKFKLSSNFTLEKNKNSLRVMSWNVEHFCILEHKNNPEKKQQMLDLINEYNPDVACFQEVVGSDKDSTAINYIPTIAKILNFKNYHYCYESKDDFDGKHHFGKIIFSKYPILNKQDIFEIPRTYENTFEFVDILKGKDTIRVFNLHLQSLRFTNENLAYIDEATTKNNIDLKKSKSIIAKLKTGFIKRQTQSEAIKQEINMSNYPVVVCGDFNDVPNSYAYYTIGKGLQNGFTEKGSAIGRTFSGISPTLRIDNIFADKSFTIGQYVRVKKKLSDHFPIIADMSLNK